MRIKNKTRVERSAFLNPSQDADVVKEMGAEGQRKRKKCEEGGKKEERENRTDSDLQGIPGSGVGYDDIGENG